MSFAHEKKKKDEITFFCVLPDYKNLSNGELESKQHKQQRINAWIFRIKSSECLSNHV